MGGITTLGDDASIGPLGAVGIELVFAVGLVLILALPTVKAGVGLGSNTDSLTGLDQGDLRSDAEGGANNFYRKTDVSLHASSAPPISAEPTVANS